MRVKIKGIEQLYQLYLKEGEKLTTEQIAAHCEITKKTLFNRYQSRQNLEDQLIEYWKHCFYSTLKKKVENANNQIEALLYFIDQFKKSVVEEQVFFRLEEKDYLKPALLHGNFFVHVVEYLIQKGIQEKLFKAEVDPKTYSICIIFNLFHLFYYPDKRETLSYPQINRDQTLRYVITLVQILLTPEGEKSFEMISIDQFMGIIISNE